MIKNDNYIVTIAEGNSTRTVKVQLPRELVRYGNANTLKKLVSEKCRVSSLLIKSIDRFYR